MPTTVERYGIVGFGRIGRRLATRFGGTDAPRLVAVLLRPEQLDAASGIVEPDCVCTDLANFLDRAPQIAVECASGAALATFGPALLAAGVDVVPLSVAALADPAVEARLRDAARLGPGRIELPAGAMASLDFLATAREDVLSAVTFRAALPPSRVVGMPIAQSVDLDRIPERICIFRGSARAVARLLPRHLNVCAGVALAGLGFDATSVEIFVDPALDQAEFEVAAQAAAGAVSVRVGPRDVGPGADPVDHTTFSVMRILRRRAARIAI